MKYSHLKFFNGVENELNLSYDETTEKWSGVVHIPEVSAGLYESINLFILEKFNNDGLGYHVFGKPSTENTSLSTYDFTFEWVDDRWASGDIFLYDSFLENDVFKIRKIDSLKLEVEDPSTFVNSIDPTTNIKNVTNYINEALQINVAISSVDDKPHYRTLRIKDSEDHVVAIIKFYGEIEKEDDRLRILLGNLGGSFKDSDFMFFKEHDIDEQGLNWKLINQKRKELLLELSNIKPFVGTYKAVLNAIKFFGYNNITLKEYWLNINQESSTFGKLKAIPVLDTSKGFSYKKRKSINLPSSNMKKTSRLSLVYKLNEPTGKFDYWDIPEVEETFDFTPEEVLIKLYGLKNILQERYLPLHAKIVDIVGEGDFFDQKNFNVWNNQQPISVFNEGKEVDFRVLPEGRQLYIEDYSLISNNSILIDDVVNQTNTNPTYLPIDISGFGDLYTQNTLGLDKKDSETLLEDFETFYENYYIINKDTHNNNLQGYHDIPVGSPLTLECTTINQAWDDANFVWDDAGTYKFSGMTYADLNLNIVSPNTGDVAFVTNLPWGPVDGFVKWDGSQWIATVDPLHIDWNNWWKQDIYEIEWLITGPNGYEQTWRGPIGYWESITTSVEELIWHPEFQKIALVLPFAGDYSVELRLYDLQNVVSYYKKNDIVNVKVKPVEVYGIYQWKEDKRWADWKTGWGQTGGIWDLPTESLQTINNNYEKLYLTMDRANYLHHEDQGKRFSMVRRFKDTDISNPTGYLETTGPYVWDEMDPVRWVDGEHNWWDATRVGPDLTPSFKIEAIQNGSILKITHKNPVTKNIEIGSHTITSPTPTGSNDISGWQLIVDELNQSTDPIINKFNFNPLFLDNSAPIGIVDECPFILCVGKGYSKTYDFESVSLTNGNVIGEVHYVGYNPTFDTSKIINGSAEVERSTHITFSLDKSQMAGMRKPTWRIYNDTNPNFDDIYYDNMWLTYIFKNPGAYKISIEVEDTNGNKNIAERNMVIVK
jgi:hypothetical protein